jgi:hypothetical protein
MVEHMERVALAEVADTLSRHRVVAYQEYFCPPSPQECQQETLWVSPAAAVVVVGLDDQVALVAESQAPPAAATPCQVAAEHKSLAAHEVVMVAQGIGGTPPEAGSFLRGGNGHAGEAGGGGGGGYYGGGGGGYPGSTFGAGGGGSGYTGGASGYTTSNITNTQGGGSAQEVNGQIQIVIGGTTTTFSYTGSEQTFVVP